MRASVKNIIGQIVEKEAENPRPPPASKLDPDVEQAKLVDPDRHADDSGADQRPRDLAAGAQHQRGQRVAHLISALVAPQRDNHLGDQQQDEGRNSINDRIGKLSHARHPASGLPTSPLPSPVAASPRRTSARALSASGNSCRAVQAYCRRSAARRNDLVRANQHHPSFAVADDRCKASPVSRHLDAPETHFRLVGKADRMDGVDDARVSAQSNRPDEPRHEKNRDQRRPELDQNRCVHLPPASASIIGRSAPRSYPARAAASQMASTLSPARARVNAHRCVERVPDRQ